MRLEDMPDYEAKLEEYLKGTSEAKFRCRTCGHEGIAVIPNVAKSPQFRCKECGAEHKIYPIEAVAD